MSSPTLPEPSSSVPPAPPLPPPPPPPPPPLSPTLSASSSNLLIAEATSPKLDAVSVSSSGAVGSSVLDDIQSPLELTAFVETIIQQLQEKFEDLSSRLTSKMDDMSTRIDSLEKSLGELMQHSVAEEILKQEATSSR
ncbi:hypothetical protein G9A89_009547 [Geosiphon pyriformis]|nr:hypothetical protein G9A89_009547 [Geosiphon pyriformis]